MSRIGRFRIMVRGAVAAAVTLPVLLTGLPAHAATADAQRGLYGSQDPAFDGAFRQSLAIVALQAAGEPVPPQAIEWLTEQQCADGGWAPYRADSAAACKPKQEDTNSTAMAVQALASVGGMSDAVQRGVAWLREQQNVDGGVGYRPGDRTDANSTALLVQALSAADVDPTRETVGGNSPVDALLDLQLGCDVPRRDRGAFAYQAGKDDTLVANDIATVAALFALTGQGYPVTQPGNAKPQPLACGSAAEPDVPMAAAAAADYLGGVLKRNSDAVPAQQGDGSDWGTTASAVLALSAFGAADEAERAMAALTEEAEIYAKAPDGEDSPASLANLVLAASASGTDPRKLADDAVSRLVATGPKTKATTSEPTQRAYDDPEPTPAGGASWGAVAAVGAIVAVGVLVLLRRREGADDR